MALIKSEYIIDNANNIKCILTTSNSKHRVERKHRIDRKNTEWGKIRSLAKEWVKKTGKSALNKMIITHE